MKRYRALADRSSSASPCWRCGRPAAGSRHLLAQLAVGDGLALRRLAMGRRADPSRRLHHRRGAVGCVIGGVPAVLLPFLLRRQPIVVAILDPFMVGGYGAPKLAFAPLFILWFGIGIESKIALVAAWCSSSSISRRCRACARSSPSSCRWRRSCGANERQVAPPHRVSRRGAGDLRRLPHRRALSPSAAR